MAIRFSAFIAVFLFALCSGAQAQQAKLKKADKLYDQLAFTAAIPLYEELAEKSDDVYVQMRLANASRLIEDFNRAELWYGSLMNVDSLDPIYKFYYAQALMANEKYEQARAWFELYSAARPEDPRGAQFAAVCRDVDQLLEQSFPAEIQSLPFNTARSEIGPAFLGSVELLFASDRDTILGIRRNNDWYDAPFLNMYVVPIDEEGSISQSKVRPLKGNVNGPWHEGPGTVQGENILYFTQSNTRTADAKDTAQQASSSKRIGLQKLSIRKALRSSGSDRWQISQETAIPFNNPAYSCAHPTLSADGQTMIFASDMPGGYGGTDLYLSTLKADGSTWSDPVNLGERINSPGDELFPFLHQDGILYFASDGWPGLGGLDVFESRQESGEWIEARNLGKPINSSRDDFGLIFDANLSSGFMVSNRFGGAGRDDIYGVRNVGIELGGTVYNSFSGEKISGASLRLRQAGQERSRTQSNAEGQYKFSVGSRRSYELVVSAPGHLRRIIPLEIADVKFPATVQLDVALEDTLMIKLVVQVVDKDSRTPLTDARVMVYNKCTNVNTEVPADEEGILRVRLEPNCTFYIAGRKLGYLDDNDVVSTMGMTQSTELATVLELIEIREDLVIELKNIYYDYGRYYIREDAVGDLDNLAGLLEQYPSLKIEISSHTDSRGSDEYNKGLSQKRAETCVDYLVTKGIDAERLVARGYGEYVLRNQCSNGVNCSEEEHQVNRRTEFKVLSFDRVLYSDEVESPAVNLYKRAFGDEGHYLSRPALVEMGLAKPGPPLIVQKSPGDTEMDPSARSSTSLLSRQQELSRAAAAGVGEELPDPDASQATTSTPTERREGRNRRNRRTVVLEPDPVPQQPIVLRPEPARTTVVAPSEKPRPPAPVATETRTESISEATSTAQSPEPKAAAVPDEEWWKSGVSYSVQIAYGTTNVSAFSEYQDLGKIAVESKSNGVPVIVVGYFQRYSEAGTVQTVLRSRGVRDAFVVSYVDGKRMD